MARNQSYRYLSGLEEHILYYRNCEGTEQLRIILNLGYRVVLYLTIVTKMTIIYEKRRGK